MIAPAGKTWSRKDFMISTALLASNPGLLRSEPGYIDAHSHVWSPDLARWPRRASSMVTVPLPLSFTPEELLAQSRPCGVTGAVLIQMSFYGFDNSYILHAVAQDREHFVGVAVVDHTAPAVEEEMRRLADGGVRGFRLGFRDRPADWAESAAMDRFWRLAGENRLAICPLLGPESLPAIGRLCSRHPSTTVVIDHLARIGALGPIQEGDVRALEALAAHASVNVKVSAFYALGGQPAPYLNLAPMIRRIFAAFGPRRLMWGSDSPFQVSNGNHYADSFALVHDHLDFLSAADRECLLRTTAERVFFQRQQSTGRA
jgi:predicted TIM-barrel fold metal-dependent hydrolase